MYDLKAFGITSPPILSKLPQEIQADICLKAKPMGKKVGKLQEKWQFPSDHIPIGLSIQGLHVASWNVLDAKHMRWITDKDAQGLKRSLIVQEHTHLENSKLTLRDTSVANTICSMMEHPTHPKSIVTLQECSQALLLHLSEIIPTNFTILAHDCNATIFNHDHLALVEAHAVTGIFSHEMDRSFQYMTFQNKVDRQFLRLINAHLPGDPTKPARFEFGAYLSNTFSPDTTTLISGDMNFNEIEMEEAIVEKAFTIFAPYCTNIAPRSLESKAIDHFIVHGSDSLIHTPNQVLQGLQIIVDLLNN